ncbi:MAG TPA: hypothetical protein VGP07_22130 [Polyangia bacterium]
MASSAALSPARALKLLRAYFVYQANNYREMPAMVQLCRDHAFDVVFFARISNWKGTPARAHAANDVANPGHAAHQDYLQVAEETARLADERLQIVVMR